VTRDTPARGDSTVTGDTPVTAALVRRLLHDQRPDLADLAVRHVADGWDNAVFRIGDRLAARLPRRRTDVVGNDLEWLPRLADRFTVPVPAAAFVGRPGRGYPFPWSIVPWFEGDLVACSPVAERRTLVADLAGFLGELHRPAPADAPVNGVRGVPLATRDRAMRERFATGLLPDVGRLRRVWQESLAAPVWSRAPLWVHGDLHPANLLARDGRLAAVIDFGDLTSGDPATDLATAWLTFDAASRAAFRDAVGPDDGTWRRARGWALLMATAIHVAPQSDAALRDVASHALRELAREDEPHRRG
jgi:aminoglycoside phosphotransferase (APT) family kinase protein